MAKATNGARLNFRLDQQQKELIDQAACLSGQSTTDFATSTLLERARDIVRQTTVLTGRDRSIFLAMLDDTDARPNAALSRAAKRFKKRDAQEIPSALADRAPFGGP